ncbi:unnamed protein product (macronuclear) [Paramecium tetraurelia]|uniref:Dolichyl-diphosphooligosaccharide-protein glycosyltransferase subunit OST5 n=1 Tax=Paramecium tetraurelia TaxID=5888 RepID=A0DKN3_PARTE|nr:uncharacterized protein GSPATT00017930001 [Paramecium tetraurelia]CAK83600.1 unnamed protein product [Paramecium tetraurelia]|eukprot:XP_001450997.1 hypothetical protein (macronuclear) [Paramecium tetraurelia strain d4-2]
MGYQAYSPPIDTKHYSNLAIVLTFIGFCFLSYFVIYQITQNKQQRSLTKELSVGLFASLFLSSGTMFSFLALGLYF